jgi:hypothetical protein
MKLFELARSTVFVAGAAVCVLVAQATASTIAQVEAQASGTPATLDQNPVVTAVVTIQGTFNGKSYPSNSFLVNDGTGSMEIFGVPNPPASPSYTPTVGDAITVSGTYSPFHQIPEIGTVTAISKVSGGNPVPAPITATIPQMNVPTLPFTLATYLINLNDVTITGAPATFGITNFSATITDSSSNSMALFYWPTSLGVSNINLFGMSVPSGPVNMTGIVSVFTPASGPAVPEFSPLTITPVPEPATGALAVIGAAAMFFAVRRMRAASVRMSRQ